MISAALVVWAAVNVAGQESPAPAAGPDSARAQFEVFLDFRDEASGRLSVVLEALRDRHPNEVRVTFRHLPPEHDAIAELPHRAALAADRQRRFWDMGRVLFANQSQHDREDVLGMAAQLQLDVTRFTTDLDDPALDDVIRDDRAYAVAAQVKAAPTLLLNGTLVTGERTLKRLESLVAAAK